MGCRDVGASCKKGKRQKKAQIKFTISKWANNIKAGLTMIFEKGTWLIYEMFDRQSYEKKAVSHHLFINSSAQTLALFRGAMSTEEREAKLTVVRCRIFVVSPIYCVAAAVVVECLRNCFYLI